MFWALVLLQTAVAPAAPPPSPETVSGGLELHLVCRGVGERKVTDGSTAFGFSSNGSSGTAFGAHTSRKDFEDQLDVDIGGTVARVRVPRRFLPPAHGGEGGWFDVKDLVVAPDFITGKVMVNFVNHPDIRLDRRTGAVSMDGKVGSYAGQCEKVDPNARAF